MMEEAEQLAGDPSAAEAVVPESKPSEEVANPEMGIAEKPKDDVSTLPLDKSDADLNPAKDTDGDGGAGQAPDGDETVPEESKNQAEELHEKDLPPVLEKVADSQVNGVSDKEINFDDKPPDISTEDVSDGANKTVEAADGVEDKSNDSSVKSSSSKLEQPSDNSTSKASDKSVAPVRSSSRSRNKSVNYNENDYIPEIDEDYDGSFVKEKKPAVPKVQNGLAVTPSVTPSLAPPSVAPPSVAPPSVAPVVVKRPPPLAPPVASPAFTVNRTMTSIPPPPARVLPATVKPVPNLVGSLAGQSITPGVSLLNAKIVSPTMYQLYVPPASTILPTSVPISLHQTIASSVLSSIVSQAAGLTQTGAAAAANRGILQSNVVSSSVVNSRAANPTPNLLHQLKTSTMTSNYKKPEPVEWVEPKSSWELIELARFETGTKAHKKPLGQLKPDSEMANVTRFLFDIGLDYVKEAVYSDLIHIQSRRKDEGKLKPKEEEDFNKLKTVHREVRERIGHLRLPMSKKCRCGFRTESINVMMHHREFARQRENDLMCCYCGFETRQSSAFAFHMESAHNSRGIVADRSAFFRCPLCPFETNVANKMKTHKAKCFRTFKPQFNLNPSCLNGNEFNFCLENIFYRDHVAAMRHKQQQLLAAQLKLAHQQAQMQKRLLPKEGPMPINNRLITCTTASMMRPGSNLIAKAAIQPFQNHFKLTPAQQQHGKMAAAAAQQFARQQRPLSGVQFRGTVRQQLQGMQQPQKEGTAILSKIGIPQVATPGSMTQMTFQHQQVVRKIPSASVSMAGVAKTPTVSDLLKARYQTPAQSAGASAAPNANSAFEVCEICGGYVKDRKALKVHFFYAHRIDMPSSVFDRQRPPLYCATCFLRFWTAQGLQKHIDIHNTEEIGSVGVTGKCIICGHRVPNILMHMRHVHNRDLNAFLKGFKCVFCGQFFSGQQPMESHMAQVHGVVVKITGGQGEKVITGKPLPQSSGPAPPQPASKNSGNQMVKGSVCVLCNLNFGRNVDLTRHCMKEHHTCMKCGMVVADRESLERHVCLMSPAGLRNCTICGERGFHPAYYVKHLRDKHLRRCAVKLKRLSGKEIRKYVRAPVPLNSPDSPITVDDDDDDEGEASSQKYNSNRSRTSRPGQGTSTSRARIVRAEVHRSDEPVEKPVEKPAVSESAPEGVSGEAGSTGAEISGTSSDPEDRSKCAPDPESGDKETDRVGSDEKTPKEETGDQEKKSDEKPSEDAVGGSSPSLVEKGESETSACVTAESNLDSTRSDGEKGETEVTKSGRLDDLSSSGEGKDQSEDQDIEEEERLIENHLSDSSPSGKGDSPRKRSPSPEFSLFAPLEKQRKTNEEGEESQAGADVDPPNTKCLLKRSQEPSADEEDSPDSKLKKVDPSIE